MPPIIKEAWAEALEPGINNWFEMAVRELADVDPVRSLFNVQSSTKSAEHVHTIGGLSPDSWDAFRKSGKAASVEVAAGYKTTFTNETYMVELPIQREWYEDEQYGLMQRMTQSLGRGAGRKRVIDMASVFNNAFSSSFVGADGVSLVNDSHPNGPNSSGTQDNNYALALNKDNLGAIREAAPNITDDKGNKAGIMYDTLFVPVGLEDTALELTASILDPESAENAINAHRGRFRVIVSPYLTDSNAWFLIDSVAAMDSLHWFDRVPVSVYLKNEDTSVFATYIARMRYSFGWSDWRWIAGSNPS